MSKLASDGSLVAYAKLAVPQPVVSFQWKERHFKKKKKMYCIDNEFGCRLSGEQGPNGIGTELLSFRQHMHSLQIRVDG